MRQELNLKRLKECFNGLMPIKDSIGEELTKILVKINNEIHYVYEDQCLFQVRPKATVSSDKDVQDVTVEQTIVIDIDSAKFLVDMSKPTTCKNNKDSKEKLDYTLLSKSENVSNNYEEEIDFKDLTDEEKEKIYSEMCNFFSDEDVCFVILRTDKGVRLEIGYY